MHDIPKEKNIEHIFISEENCIRFLFEDNILNNYDKCMQCNIGNIKIYDYAPKQWRCTNYNCLKAVSIFKDSFFSKSKVKCNDLMRICYKWLAGQKYNDILIQTQHSSKLISWTTRFCRELVAKNVTEEANIIGGPGIIVEVDESKFGKVKYGHGHWVEGVWILGAVERTLERKVLLKAVSNRNRETLMTILGSHIAAGSIIHSDLWRGYFGMEEYLNVTHKTVKHSENFKDPDTGVHTNTIEGTWCGVKYKIAPRNRTKEVIDDHLAEFIWRRQNAGKLWKSFLTCLRDTKYI